MAATIIWHCVSLSDNKTNVKPPFSQMEEELTQFFVGPGGACESCVNSLQGAFAEADYVLLTSCPSN